MTVEQHWHQDGSEDSILYRLPVAGAKAKKKRGEKKEQEEEEDNGGTMRGAIIFRSGTNKTLLLVLLLHQCYCVDSLFPLSPPSPALSLFPFHLLPHISLEQL